MSSHGGTVLVLFALQRVGGETRGDDGIASGEPTPRKEEEAREKQRDSELGDANHGASPTINRRHDLEIALEPESDEADESEADHGRRVQLRLHAEEADEGDDEHK